MNRERIIADEAKYIVPTYVRPEMVFSHGEGVYLFDSDGNRYLDFMAGIAVNALGYGDPQWVDAVSDQAQRLAHVSNLFHTEPHVALARRLVENSFADRVFFCNSGSEANETALKFARKYAREVSSSTRRVDKVGIVAFSGGFHGRTMGALSTTARQTYREPFAPLIGGVAFADFNDIDSARAAIDDSTCAVIVEPVQGEGGVNPATPTFLRELRDFCDEHEALLIFDEVQCGLGRTGTLWAHQQYDVEPDIMTLAKPLAGGLPIGATLVREHIAEVIGPGDHGSTFAAGALVCRAAQVVFDRINDAAFLAAIREKSTHLLGALAEIGSPLVRDIRGSGLLVGVELTIAAKPVLSKARESGLIIINAGDNVVRLCPPLTVEAGHIDEAVRILSTCLSQLEDLS